MEPFTPSASANASIPSSWHHGGHFGPSFHDSAYAREDSDSVPLLLSDPSKTYGGTNQVHRISPRTRHHRAAAFVSAQLSHPAASRACHLSHDSFTCSRRTHDLQPRAFEQHHGNDESGSYLQPTASYNQENFGREPGHIAFRSGVEENISPLDFEEHRVRVPHTLVSLSNRTEGETDHPLHSSTSIRHGSVTPDIDLKAAQSRSTIKPTEPGYRSDDSVRSSARRPRQNQLPRGDAQLAAAWQQLYQERTELEKERRDLRKKEKSFLRRKQRSRLSWRDSSDGMDGEGLSGTHSLDGEYA